ncbi:hypothetical protein K504DRAFT_394517 [Pleomassaria siparia CBS 279.74]|uniref:Uncharacterized protein n=1 Tax=Pleomassaria siparia CBS 279.74 TaxID=1314801 RepID=A0A6G1JQ71_9PLEO|nr:hypothetical protein K504DRAFT_394517 [Pleomassaria siparia CBS 279.74]
MRNNNANTSGHWQLVCTQLIRPYLYERDTQFTSSDRDLNTILERINQDLTDLGSLKERFQTLQQEMLSNVDRTNPIPDTQFEQDFRSLTAAIKTVSRTVPPQSLDRICTDFDNFTLTRHVRKSYWSSRGRRRCFVEAAIWSILVDCVFQSPFGILGDRCTIFTNIWKQLFGLSHGLSWPHPSVACETWRWNTMEQLVSGAGRKTITLGDEDMESAETKGNTDLQNSVQQARLKVYLRIEGILKPLDPDFDTSRLWPIVNQAFTLALDMFTQRCRLQTMAPDPDDLYIAGVSDHLESLQESEDVKFGRVAFTVNPGLSKWGDAHGKKLDERLFIVPSLVLLEEYMPKGP